MTRNWLHEARALDEADRLKGFRSRFHLLKDGIYMDGNSLGLASVDALKSLEQAAEEWRTRGIGGWLEAAPDWFSYGERIGAAMAPLVGAHPDEVVMTGSTTSNLHTLVATFFTPKEGRRKILADELNFPSDLYALESQIRMKGGDPARDLLLAKSADGRTLDEDDIIGMMDKTVALALLPGVLYRSGQLLDIRRLTKAAHERGVARRRAEAFQRGGDRRGAREVAGVDEFYDRHGRRAPLPSRLRGGNAPRVGAERRPRRRGTRGGVAHLLRTQEERDHPRLPPSSRDPAGARGAVQHVRGRGTHRGRAGDDREGARVRGLLRGARGGFVEYRSCDSERRTKGPYSGPLRFILPL